MAENSDREILDLPEKKGKPKRFDNLIIFFLAILMIGILLRIYSMPGSDIAVVLGAVGLTGTYALRFFFAPKQSLFQLLQLIFGGLLVAAIVVDIAGFGIGSRISRAAMWLLIPMIILGLYSYFSKNDKA